MGLGVYHATQKALTSTVDRKPFNFTGHAQKNSTHTSEYPETGGQPLATQQALRLGQSLKKQPKLLCCVDVTITIKWQLHPLQANS